MKTFRRQTSPLHLWLMWLVSALAACLSPCALAQGVIIPGPTIAVNGGLTVKDPDNDPRVIEGVFTWRSHVELAGLAAPRESRSPSRRAGQLSGMTPVDRKVPKFSTTGLSLYEFPTDPSGNLTAEFVIPFDDGINGIGGNLANIPRPGIYKIYAIRPSATTVLDRADSTSFVLCPDTIFC